MLQNQHPSAMSIETDHNKVFIKNKLKFLIIGKTRQIRCFNQRISRPVHRFTIRLQWDEFMLDCIRGEDFSVYAAFGLRIERASTS